MVKLPLATNPRAKMGGFRDGFVKIFARPGTGMVLGGVVVTYWSWRDIFLINVPVGVVGMWMNRRYMPDYRLDDVHPFDLLGFLLFAAASAMLLTASEVASGGGGQWARIAIYGVLAIVFGTTYVWHSRRNDHPVADLSLLRVRSVCVSLAGNLFTRLGVSGMFLLLVLFLQVGCGWSPFSMPLSRGVTPAAVVMARNTTSASTSRAAVSRFGACFTLSGQS